METLDNRDPSRKTPYAVLVVALNPDADLLRTVVDSLRSEIPGDIIIVDDGSTNGTITGPLSDLFDVVVRLEKNIGVPAATNIGLDLVRDSGYKICFRSDADDVTYHGRFMSTLRAFQENKDAIVVGGLSEDCSPDGKVVRVYGTPMIIKRGEKDKLYPISPARHSTIAIDMGKIGDVRYDVGYPLCQDYALMFDIVAVGGLVVVPEVFVRYLTGPSTRSFRQRRRQLAYRAKTFAEKGTWFSLRHYSAFALLAISVMLPEWARPRLGAILSKGMRKVVR